VPPNVPLFFVSEVIAHPTFSLQTLNGFLSLLFFVFHFISSFPKFHPTSTLRLHSPEIPPDLFTIPHKIQCAHISMAFPVYNAA
jgi:hypothetical protein